MRLHICALLFFIFCISSSICVNFNIFRWPTFKLYKVASPLKGLARLKNKAFSSLADIKRPIIKGLEDLKNHVGDFKKSLFSNGQDDDDYEEPSSYHKRPKSHYGSGNYGYFQIAFQPLSSEYGPPPEPSYTDAAPPEPSQGYRPSSHLSQSYGVQNTASNYGSSHYDSQHTLSSDYGVPSHPSSKYVAPSISTFGFGAPQSQSLYNVQNNNPIGLQPPPIAEYHSGNVGQSNSFQGGLNSLNSPTNSYSAPKQVSYSATGFSSEIRPRPIPNNQYNQQYHLQQQNKDYNSINAPLSAAMAMGHILTEDEVIFVGGGSSDANSHANDIGKWKPLFRLSPQLLPAQVHTGSQTNIASANEPSNTNINMLQSNNIAFSNNNNANSILLVSDGNTDFANQNNLNLRSGDTATRNSQQVSIAPQSNVIQNSGSTHAISQLSPASGVTIEYLPPIRSQLTGERTIDPLILEETKSTRIPTVLTPPSGQRNDIIFWNGGFIRGSEQEHLSNAEDALSKLVDETILVTDSESFRELPTALPPKNVVSRSPPQEETFPVQEIVISGDRQMSPHPNISTNIGSTIHSTIGSNQESAIPSNAGSSVVSGQQQNKLFSNVMEELQLNVMTDLIRRANLQAMLTTQGSFTIFAPVDSSLSRLPRSAAHRLSNDTERLREVVLFHVVPGQWTIQDLTDNQLLDTASPRGRKLRVNFYDFGADMERTVTVNGARVVRSDVHASTGVLHVLDRLLYPMVELSVLDHLTQCDVFTGANVAVTGAGLTALLAQEGPYTLFLPATEAFAAIDNDTVNAFLEDITLLQNVLLYHIVPGAHFSSGLLDGQYLPTLVQDRDLQVQVNTDGHTRRLSGVGHSATVIKADIVATNGVIHIIDVVLRPESEVPLCGHF